MFVLWQDFVPSGESLRWQSHQNYYQSEGLNVFLRQEVPYNITSNPCYATEVARLFITQNPNPTSPLSLLELGGGNGVFAYNFLKALEKQSALHFEQLHYTLSDFSEPLLDQLAQMKAFAHWQNTKKLRFKPVDASGAENTFANETKTSWDGIIANYLFSTFPTEVLLKQSQSWHIEKTRLCLPLSEAVLQFTEQYLNTRDLSTQVKKEHPQHSWFIALAKAQKEVAKTLQAQRDKDSEYFSYLSQQVLSEWLRVLHSQNINVTEHSLKALVESLCLTPLKTALQPFLQKESAVTESLDRRFFEYDTQTLPKAHQTMLKESPSLTPFSYSPVILDALSYWKTQLKDTGIIVISDKAVTQAHKEEQVQIARHGGTLSHGVNFDLCQHILPNALTTQKVHHPIQTLVYGAHISAELKNCFKKNWVEHPKNMLSHALLEGGQALLQSDRTEAAYRSLKEALNYRPEDSTLQYFCALCCLNNGQNTKALTILNHPHDDIFRLFNREILLAEAYRSTGQYAKAAPYYKASMDYGENALGYYQLAICQKELGHTSEAIASVEKALLLSPEDKEIQGLKDLLISI